MAAYYYTYASSLVPNSINTGRTTPEKRRKKFRQSFDFARVVKVLVQAGRDRLFLARPHAAAADVLQPVPPVNGGGRRTVLAARAPEVLPAQVRGRLRLGRLLLRRRARDHRDRRVVDGHLVAAITGVEVAGRRVPVASRFLRGRLVRQLGRRQVFDAAARLTAGVHPRQRIVTGRAAGRVRLLGRRR